jgi:hypothetical protein
MEDVTDIIYQITPEDKPFWMISGEASAHSPMHQWQQRSLTTRQDNANAEGFIYSMTAAMTMPSRIVNFTQIIKKEIRVSNTMQASEYYGISDMFADQMEIRLAEIGTDAEHALLRGSQSSSDTDASPRMQGLILAITSNQTTYTLQGPTSTLTESAFNDHIQTCWDEGGEPRDVLVGGYLKRRISSFTGGNTKFIPADQQRQVNTISLYESDFFPVQIHLSRDIPKQGDNVNNDAGSLYSGYAILFMDRTMCKKAFLRRFTSHRTPEVADSADGVIKGELTLEWGHPSAHFYSDEYQ